MENFERIKQEIISKKVTILYLNFIDLKGQIRSKGIFTNELLKNFDGFFKEGISVTANLIDSNQEECDFFIIRPIADTFTLIDWIDRGENNAAYVLCEIINSAINSRMVAEKIAAVMKKKHIKPIIGLGLTYQITGFLEVEGISGLYRCFPGSEQEKFNNDLALSLMHGGIELEYSIPCGQNYHHLAFVPQDILKSIDNHSIGKWISTAYMLKRGIGLHFTKPFENAAPVHFSLWSENGDDNLFYNPSDQFELSCKGYAFIAGVLKNFDEIFAVIIATSEETPRVNYKKTYSFSDDDSVISAPCYYHENKKIVRSGWSKRCIFRGIGSDVNLYLVTSCILAAGFEGIQNNYAVSQYVNNEYGVFSSSIEEKRDKLMKCALFEDLLGASIMRILEQNLIIKERRQDG